MTHDLLKHLFDYKVWADAQLFPLLASVSADQHANALHSAIRTMNHIHVVDQIFRAHLTGGQHAYQSTNTSGTPRIPALRAAVAATDAWYAQYVAGATSQHLSETLRFTFTDGDSGSMTREEMLLHVITHGGSHRAVIGQILKGLSVTPPRDLLTRFLHVSEPARRGLS